MPWLEWQAPSNWTSDWSRHRCRSPTMIQLITCVYAHSDEFVHILILFLGLRNTKELSVVSRLEWTTLWRGGRSSEIMLIPPPRPGCWPRLLLHTASYYSKCVLSLDCFIKATPSAQLVLWTDGRAPSWHTVNAVKRAKWCNIQLFWHTGSDDFSCAQLTRGCQSEWFKTEWHAKNDCM